MFNFGIVDILSHIRVTNGDPIVKVIITPEDSMVGTFLVHLCERENWWLVFQVSVIAWRH